MTKWIAALGFLLFGSLAANAQGAPCQWSYNFVNGIATATYCGTVRANIFNLALPSGDIFVGNSNGIAAAVPMSGDGTITDTGVVTIKEFSSSISGKVPPSGGGTTNFLRADGTWNVPPLANFNGVGDGTTNNFTALQTACNAGGKIVFGAGTFLVNLPSATSLCTPVAGTVFQGSGQGNTILKFVAADTNQVNVFEMNANKIYYLDMTIQIITPTGGTIILCDMKNIDGLNFINDEISSNAVEGLTIGGTATAGDTLNVAFLRNGTTTIVTTTVTAGQTTAQMATAVAASINANGTVSGWGVIATASGSFVGIVQPDTLTPQASYTLSVTGSATETLTPGFSNLSVVFNNQTNGDEADDVLVQNVYMHDLVYNVLKSNTSTQINKRWSFRGGNFDRVFGGFVNINSPSGVFSDVDVDGISGEATGLNDLDALPIAASNVQNMTLRGVRFSGTYNQNAFHFEEGSSVSTADDIAYEATSGNAGVGYNGTCLYTVDNDIGAPGTFKGVKNSSFDGITCIKADSNSQGYGAWLAINTVASDGNSLTNFKAIGWPGGVRNDGFQHFILGPFSLTNFGPSTGTTAIINNQATGTILNFIPNNYATGLNNAGGASRPSNCTGTTC